MAGQNQRKIIVMEDDVAMADIVTHKLETKGFVVKHAPDGAEGWEMIQKEPPDLVLLDLMMPEMDGFQVLEKIRDNADKKIANLPVIVLSNLWSNKDILRTQSLRADEYMVKAYFTPDEISAKIEEVLKRHQAKNN